MIISPGNFQHIGARSSQQDSFAFSDKDDQAFVAHGGVLAVVADGMGGLAKGGDASRLAVTTFLKAYMAKETQEAVGAALLRSLGVANEAVVALARQLGEEGNVGTTLVAAVVHQEVLYWVSVGDSGLYLWRKGVLTRLTEEHNYGREIDQAANRGEVSREEAIAHPERRSLTSFVGLVPLVLIDRNLRPFSLDIGDRIMLCSDGLDGVLREDEMRHLLGDEPQRAAEALGGIALAKGRKGQDNLTIAILACEGDNMPLSSSSPDRLSAVVLPSGIAASVKESSWFSWARWILLAVFVIVIGVCTWLFALKPSTQVVSAPQINGSDENDMAPKSQTTPPPAVDPGPDLSQSDGEKKDQEPKSRLFSQRQPEKKLEKQADIPIETLGSKHNGKEGKKQTQAVQGQTEQPSRPVVQKDQPPNQREGASLSPADPEQPQEQTMNKPVLTDQLDSGEKRAHESKSDLSHKRQLEKKRKKQAAIQREASALKHYGKDEKKQTPAVQGQTEQSRLTAAQKDQPPNQGEGTSLSPADPEQPQEKTMNKPVPTDQHDSGQESPPVAESKPVVNRQEEKVVPVSVPSKNLFEKFLDLWR